MNYSTATVDVTLPNGIVETFDLETVSDENAMVDELWATFKATLNEEEEDNEEERDDFAGNLTFDNPQGFAVHLFKQHTHVESTHGQCSPVSNFDELLEAWSDETDDDRREAMADYLDNGADDLSDFDEAYQGQHASGADFAEQLADELGAVSEDTARWVCIDWEATWERNLRHDYWISDSGHVFRNL